MGSDGEGSLKKKDKKDKDKDKDKHEKKDKGKDKDKDEKKDKHKGDKDKGDKDKGDKDKGDKDKGDKDKKDKDKGKDEKKDKGKDEKKDKGKDEKKDKDKKDKKDEHGDEKKKKDKDKDKKDKPSQPSGTHVSSGPVHGGEAAGYYNPSGAPPQPSQPVHPPQSGETPWFLREPGAEVHGQPPPPPPPRSVPDFPNPNSHYTSQPPPLPVGNVGVGQPAQKVPPSGYRIPLDPNAQFPGPDQLGLPPTTDSDGLTPVFIGSAIFPDSVQPCKIIPSLHPPCRVSSGGSELEYHGRFDLLPITSDMEWVLTSHGQIPPGHRPVEGGYEPNGGKLYHALGSIQGAYIPGKAGEHLRGASIPLRGTEHILQENYSILCWR